MTDSERQGRGATWSRWLIAFLAAVALQVPLYGFYFTQTRGSEETWICDPGVAGYIRHMAASAARAGMDEAWRGRCEPAQARTIRGVAVRTREEPPEEPPEELPEDAQVVEVPDQSPPEDLTPVETRFVSDRDARTERETRSERTARSTQRAPGDVPVTDPAPVQSEVSDSPDPTVTTEEQETVIELADARPDLPEAERGEQAPRSVVERGQDNRILLPVGSDEAALANLQGLSGDFTTTDHLPDVERGTSTVLNANRYRYADFFMRVKGAVERHWQPAQVYRRRDPTGRVYGVKDRYTLLRVTLDDEGRLVRLLTMRDSGLDFMDEEARAAFQRAQPFPNPPAGLLNPRNEVVFEFGFYFEITAGRLQSHSRWRRL